jgi:hypothetical protein
MPVPIMMIKELLLFSVMIAYAVCLLLLNMPIDNFTDELGLKAYLTHNSIGFIFVCN